VISCTLDNCFLGKVDRYGRTLSLFNIPGICNPRVMTCRKGPNGNEMNVAFILLPACWNTIMSSIAPLAHPMTKARKGTTISKISRNGIVYRDGYLCARCTNDRLCCIFVTDRILVESTGENGTAVLIFAELDIQFIKSTMFRSFPHFQPTRPRVNL
jgi:hypothetical protein